MFWLPYISLVVFLLLIIPFVIYGFKKGWVYSLVFSFALWIVTLVFVGINHLIYKYLWQAYSYLFLEKNLKVEINLENLSNFYKPQIILLATGIEIILIYPITFLLMFFINKLIRKYFGHKVENINKSEKSILYRRKISWSRLSGTIILTINSLFSISLIASAINIITIPYKKSNFTTSLNDQIGKIYSLGLGENTKSAQIISNFLRMELDESIASSMNELVAFRSDENPNSDNSFPNVKKIKHFRDNILKFKELFTNKEASKAIFTSVVKQNVDSINPLTFDKNTISSLEDVNKNKVGYNKQARDNDLEALKAFVNKDKIKVFLEKDLIEALVLKFQKSFIDFSKTIFYYKYKLWLLEKEKNNQKLLKRKNDLSNYKNSLLDYKSERKELIFLLSALSGGKFVGDFNQDEPLSFPILKINRVMPGSGNFKNQFDLEISMKSTMDNDEVDKNAKELKYENYKRDSYDPQKKSFDIAKFAHNDAKAKLLSLKQELSESKSSKVSAQGKIRDLESNIEKIKSNIGFKENIIINLKAENVRNQEEIDILNKPPENSQKQKDIQEKKEEIKKNKVQIEIENRSLSQLKTNLRNENSNLNVAKIALNNYANEIRRWEQGILNQEGIVKNAETELLKKESVLIPITNKNNENLQAFKDALSKFEESQRSHMMQEIKVDNLIDDYEIKKNDLEYKNAEIVSSKDKIDNLEDKKETLLFTTPAIEWEKKDDESIYYLEQLLQFNQEKINQTFEIQENKKKVFENLKKEIILNYRKFLGE